MGRKYNLESVKKAFEDAGCKLISTEYRTCTDILQYYCNCGSTNVHEIQFFSFVAGKRCKECTFKRAAQTRLEKYGYKHFMENEEFQTKLQAKLSESRKDKINEVRDYIERNGCKLLSNNYTNSKEKLQVQFECGCIGNISYNKFSQGRRCGNQTCKTQRARVTRENNVTQ